ncbi:hypothetical protein HRH25_21295 [Flavisolibacter sp. BT320]|nr:hypothetical protein [Flavisolibacter longurius]
MLEEVEFLYDHQLVAEIEDLIRKAKNKLILISPFIDLDAKIVDALNEKKGLHNFELHVLFGKNENNYLRSIKRDSLEFFKQFPNVEIRYNERLHAKFYQNDFDYIVTSLNLYDYSLNNNIEVGIKCEYGAKGVLGKTIDTSISILGQGVEKVKQEVLGMEKKISPIEKFKSIFEASELKYKTQPILAEKGGIQGFIGGKKLDGFDVVVNNLEVFGTPKQNPANDSHSANIEVKVSVKANVVTNVYGKCLSASQLSKIIGVQGKEITSYMERCGLIHKDGITETGKAKGLIFKNYMGNDYIAYPENLEELNDLKR